MIKSKVRVFISLMMEESGMDNLKMMNGVQEKNWNPQCREDSGQVQITTDQISSKVLNMEFCFKSQRSGLKVDPMALLACAAHLDHFLVGSITHA